MLYILGGVSRAGKSIIADKFVQEKAIPFFSSDFLTMGLERGLPEYGVNSDIPASKRAYKLWPIIKGIATTLLDIDQDYLIEGDSLLPEHILDLVKEKGEDKVKVCFIGYKDITPEQKLQQIKDFPSDKNDWINEETDEFILKFMQEEITRSQQLESECRELGIKYIDMSDDFQKSIQKVFNYFFTA